MVDNSSAGPTTDLSTSKKRKVKTPALTSYQFTILCHSILYSPVPSPMALTSILLRRSQGHLLWRPLLGLQSCYPLHFALFSSYLTSPSSLPFSPVATPNDDVSDFEPEPVGPTKPDTSELQSFIQLLSSAKSLSSSPKQALSLLNSSSAVELSKELVCRAMWEVRQDWELALFAFRWGEECVAYYPWAWHFIIQVVCKKERFDLAWVLVRRMYRNAILTQRALVIIMEW